MIEIKNLVKKYDETLAINDLNITFKEGIYGLVGHNGAGKSTLLRIISNVVYKTSGTITVNGHDSKTKEARDNIFFLPDYPYSKGNMDIDQMYKFYSIFYDIDKDNFYRLINEFELPLKRRISTFSKGMRRQAFIALSLSMNRNVILMDEPFDGLDPLVLIKIKERCGCTFRYCGIVLKAAVVFPLPQEAKIKLSRPNLKLSYSITSEIKLPSDISYHLHKLSIL